MRKKLQVFISSTYTDMLEERQAAVEAILSSGHIPAGMELFSAGNESQLEVIKRWIDESDIYLLILGGRYGTIEPTSGLSYIQIEYDYAAFKKKIPFFSVVINELALEEKTKKYGIQVIEHDNPEKYKNFRDIVTGKMCKFFDDVKDIKIAIHQTLSEYQLKYNLPGWVCGKDIQNAEEFIKQNSKLLTENSKLRKQIELINSKLSSETRLINGYTIEQIKNTLESFEVTIDKEIVEKSKDIKTNVLEVFVLSKDKFAVGVENSQRSGSYEIFLFYKIAPKLMMFGLLETVKVPGVQWQRIQTSKNGHVFLGQIEIEKIEEKSS